MLPVDPHRIDSPRSFTKRPGHSTSAGNALRDKMIKFGFMKTEENMSLVLPAKEGALLQASPSFPDWLPAKTTWHAAKFAALRATDRRSLPRATMPQYRPPDSTECNGRVAPHRDARSEQSS